MPKPKILIVDDEERIRFAVRDFFELQDYDVVEAETCAAAEAVLPNDLAFFFRIQSVTGAGFLWDDNDVASIRQARENG